MNAKFVRAGTLGDLNAKGRFRSTRISPTHPGRQRPGLRLRLDNRCPHMGFALDRGSVDDGILTCHWHHARFDLASGCTSLGA